MSASYSAKVVRHTLSFVWLDVVRLLVSAVGSIWLARVLGPSDRGLLAIVLSFCGITTIVTIMGINASFRTLHPKGMVSLGSYYQAVWRLASLASLGALIGIPITVAIVSGGFQRADIVIVSILLAGLSLSSLAVLDACKAVGNIRGSSRIDLAGAVFTTMLITLVPTSFADPGIYLLIYLFSYFLRIVLGITVLRRGGYAGPGTRSERKLVMKTGRKFMGFSIGQHLILQSDAYLVGLAAGTYSAGIYSVGATLSNPIKMPASALGQVLNLESANGRLVWEKLRNFITLAFLVTVVLAFTAYIVSEPLILLLFGEEYRNSVDVLRILLVAQVLLAPYPLVSRSLAGLGVTRAISLTGAIGAVLSIILMLTLGSHFGASGAAVGCAITYATMTVSMLVIAKKSFRDDPQSAKQIREG